MEIDSDGDEDYSKSSEDGDQGDDKGERWMYWIVFFTVIKVICLHQ